jgi:spore maturation protein SpmA
LSARRATIALVNVAWPLFILVALGVALGTGSLEALGPAMLDSAEAAVKLALGLVGPMALWLGLLHVVEDAGGIARLSRALAPLFRRLFPQIPADHPALGAMLLNLSANFFGLANAATPFGLKAMESLQRLNSRKDTATNAMILFLVLNTAGVTAMPLSTMVLRASAGSHTPGTILLPTMLATLLSATLAALICLAIQRLPRVKASEPAAEVDAVTAEVVVLPALSPMRLWIGVAIIGVGVAWHMWHTHLALAELSNGLLPLLAGLMIVFGLSAHVRIYESVVTGAKEGFQVAVRIIPYLVLILVAVAMCRAAGVIDFMVAVLRHVTDPLGLPAEVLPQVLLRPLSGSGTLGLMADTFKTYGPDSLVGYCASILYGSSETTFYVFAVYFGAIGVRRTRYAVVVCLIADLVGVCLGTLLAHVFYRPV